MEYILIWLCGIVDRIRGDEYDMAFGTRITDKLTYGWLIAALFGYPMHWLTLAIMAGFYFGISIGWGLAVGSAIRGERPIDEYSGNKWPWWMFGWTRKNAWFALFVRGLITGLPLLPLAYFDWRLALIVPIYAVSFPLAIALALLLNKLTQLTDSWVWEQQELFRGWLSGGLIFAAMKLI